MDARWLQAIFLALPLLAGLPTYAEEQQGEKPVPADEVGRLVFTTLEELHFKHLEETYYPAREQWFRQQHPELSPDAVIDRAVLGKIALPHPINLAAFPQLMTRARMLLGDADTATKSRAGNSLLTGISDSLNVGLFETMKSGLQVAYRIADEPELENGGAATGIGYFFTAWQPNRQQYSPAMGAHITFDPRQALRSMGEDGLNDENAKLLVIWHHAALFHEAMHIALAQNSLFHFLTRLHQEKKIIIPTRTDTDEEIAKKLATSNENIRALQRTLFHDPRWENFQEYVVYLFCALAYQQFGLPLESPSASPMLSFTKQGDRAVKYGRRFVTSMGGYENPDSLRYLQRATELLQTLYDRYRTKQAGLSDYRFLADSYEVGELAKLSMEVVKAVAVADSAAGKPTR